MGDSDQRAQKLRIKELYNPQLASIHVGPNSRQLSVPRSLVCDLSDYFRAAFEGKYSKGTTGVITLPKVDEWTFECFIIWLYTRELSSAPWLDAGNEGPPATDDGEQEEPEEKGDSTSTTVHHWYWSYLIELYIFADQYDTKALRRGIIEAMINRTHQGAWPDTEQLIRAFNNIPDSSPVYRLMLDIVVNEDWPNDFKTLAAELPFSVTMELCSRLKVFQLSSRERCREESKFCARCLDGWGICELHSNPEYIGNFRTYYEADTEEELRSSL